MEGENKNVRFVVYALIGGQATKRFFAHDKEELLEIIDNDLQEEIDEEVLYQENNNYESEE